MPFAPSQTLLVSLFFIWDGLAFSIYLLFVAMLLAACRRIRITDLIAGGTTRFEPMVQTSAQTLQMVFDDSQPDLFKDPSFYDEKEQNRIAEALKKARATQQEES